MTATDKSVPLNTAIRARNTLKMQNIRGNLNGIQFSRVEPCLKALLFLLNWDRSLEDIGSIEKMNRVQLAINSYDEALYI